jgi:iron(III) transport system substrate-binding protein
MLLSSRSSINRKLVNFSREELTMSVVVRHLILSFFLVFSLGLLGGMSQAAQGSGEVVVYSGRAEPLLKLILELFEKQTAIKTIVKYGNGAVLAQQILEEQKALGRSADLFIHTEAGTFESLRLDGALHPYNSESTRSILVDLRARDGSWTGLSGRSRAILYNKNLVKPNELPNSIFDLTAPKWKGKIAATNSANASFFAWVSALRLTIGDDRAQDFLSKLKENTARLSASHTDVRKAVGRGEFALGLINHYYYHIQLEEPDVAVRNVGIIFPDQKSNQIGTLILAAAGAILKNSRNLGNAQKLLDFLTGPDGQKFFAEVNYEYPLRPAVPTRSEVLKAVQDSLGCAQTSAIACLKQLPIPLDALGGAFNKTRDLLVEIGW